MNKKIARLVLLGIACMVASALFPKYENGITMFAGFILTAMYLDMF